MLLTIREVAAILRLSQPTVRKLCEVGTLPSMKVSMRGLRVPQEAVDTYLRQLSSGEVSLESATTPRRVPAVARRPAAAPAARGARRANR